MKPLKIFSTGLPNQLSLWHYVPNGRPKMPFKLDKFPTTDEDGGFVQQALTKKYVVALT